MLLLPFQKENNLKQKYMKKLVVLITVVLLTMSCGGKKSGPLAKEEFYSADKNTGSGMGMGQATTGTKPTIEKANVSIQPCEGCIMISDLLAGKKNYEGKTIKIKGSVTKFNAEIMGKNWVHIQDGTESAGEFDLTVTTNQLVSVGDIVTFEGKISLDKDFGYGYFYKILLEDAKLVQ